MTSLYGVDRLITTEPSPAHAMRRSSRLSVGK